LFPFFRRLSHNARRARALARPSKPQDPQKKPEPGDDVISMETNLIVVNVTVTDAIENYVSGSRSKISRFWKTLPPANNRSHGRRGAFRSRHPAGRERKHGEQALAGARGLRQFPFGLRDGDMVAVYSFSGFKVKTLQISANRAKRPMRSGT